MVITVEMYEQIRKLHLAGESQRGIARKLGISRKSVRKYMNGDTVPWEKQTRKRDATVLTPEVMAQIASYLEQDEEEGTQKQHHTARRIYNRLVEELHFTGGESTVRSFVQKLRATAKEAYIPLAFQPGDAVQIDWGEAKIWLKGKKVTVNLFCAQLCCSDAPFVVAYRRQNSESFLEALVRTFDYFGGVPHRVIFDNARIAVKDGFGSHASTQETYGSLAAHYGFEPVFCNVASGNEKGLVEGLVGFSRRNFCVPIPRVESMDALNAMLVERCNSYLAHKVQGKSADVATLYREEKDALYPLPGYRYDPAKRTQARVSRYSTVRYDTNSYSVPVAYCGKTVGVKALPECIEIYFDGECIASHERAFGHSQDVYQLEHYLSLLRRKARAVFQARPVLDNVPEYFLNWLRSQELKPKELVALLERSVEIGYDAVMRGEIPQETHPENKIPDTVSVAQVDLRTYDQRYLSRREEVCT